MANQTYDLVCEALSRIISRKAAENIVSDALRGAKLSLQDVRPEQMQTLLKSVIFARLQQIIPVAQAKGEIRQILNTLETQFRFRAFSPEIEEGWNALRKEFKRLPNPKTPRAERLAKNIADLPNQADPARILDELWVELDLLQLEASGNSPTPAEPHFQGDLLLESGEFAALNFELDLPENASPVFGRPGTGLGVRVPQEDPVLRSSLDEEMLRSSAAGLQHSGSVRVGAQLASQDLNLTIVDEPLDFPRAEVPPLEINLDSLIEIPSPALAVQAEVVQRPQKPPISLESTEAKEALLTRFALEEGVTGVLLCKRSGEVLMSRLSSGTPQHLASVVAATTILLSKRRSFKVFYAHLETVSAFVAPIGQNILAVLADASVNVGRVFTELESLKESA
ncbi:MAG: hypothetical protein ACK41E_08890 [Deinococcales bacterium]